MYKLSNRSKERVNGILPIMQVIIETAISDPECPEDFGIPQYGGKRTAEDQQELYAKGRTDFTTHQRPVTYVDGVRKKSNHQAKEDGYGHAFDVYIYDHATKSASWNVDRLTELAEHIIKVAISLGINISWGGNWTKFKDYPHFEYIGKLNK